MPNDPAYVLGMSPPAPAIMTADELLRIPDKHAELVRGVLVVREPAGFRHGRVTMQVYDRLRDHASRTGAGQVFASEIGFQLASHPDTVRAPDVAFISRERLPDPQTPGFPALGPDLVVEIVSPGDRPGETLAKVADWLNGGTRLVWIVDPERRLARVHRHDGSVTLVAEHEGLDGEDVVPGFFCPLATIL